MLEQQRREVAAQANVVEPLHEIAEPAPLRRQRMVFARFSLLKKLLDRDGHTHAWLVRIDSTCYGVQRRQTVLRP